MSTALSELPCSEPRRAEWTQSSFIRMTIVIEVRVFPLTCGRCCLPRYGSKRVVRAADGYDVATAFIQCSKTYSGTARKFSLLL